MLALFEEAVLVYKSILDEHCDYVPALKGTENQSGWRKPQTLIKTLSSGLGETYISFARSSLNQDFHGRAIDYIQNAIIVLARYSISILFLVCLLVVHVVKKFILYSAGLLNVMVIFHVSGSYLVMHLHLFLTSTRATSGLHVDKWLAFLAWQIFLLPQKSKHHHVILELSYLTI